MNRTTSVTTTTTHADDAPNYEFEYDSSGDDYEYDFPGDDFEYYQVPIYDFSNDNQELEILNYSYLTITSDTDSFRIDSIILDKYKSITGKELEYKKDNTGVVVPRTDQVLNSLMAKYQNKDEDYYKIVHISPNLFEYTYHLPWVSNVMSETDSIMYDIRRMFYEAVRGEDKWKSYLEEISKIFYDRFHSCPPKDNILEHYWVTNVYPSWARGYTMEFEVDWCRILQEYYYNLLPKDIEKYLLDNEEKKFYFKEFD